MRFTADIALVVCVAAVATDGGLAKKLRHARRAAFFNAGRGREPIKISSNIGFGGGEGPGPELLPNFGQGQRQGFGKELGFGMGVGVGGAPQDLVGGPGAFGGGIGSFGQGFGIGQPQVPPGYYGGAPPVMGQPGGGIGAGSGFFQGFGPGSFWQQPAGLGFGQGYQPALGIGQYQPYPSYGKQRQPSGTFGSWDPFGIFKGVGGLFGSLGMGGGFSSALDGGLGGFGRLGNFPDYKRLLYQALGRRASSFHDINIIGSSMSEQNYEQHYAITFTTSSGGYPRTCTASFTGTNSGSGVIINPQSVNISC